MEWKQVHDIDLNERRILLNIDKFSWYSFITAPITFIPRILSHLNQLFQAYAYVFYRRSLETGTLVIKVVFVSSYVREKFELMKMADDWGDFHSSDKEHMNFINTDRCHEIHLKFHGKEIDSHTFKIDNSELDGDGYVIDNFSQIQVNFPAKGSLEITVDSKSGNKLFKLNVDEKEDHPKRTLNGRNLFCSFPPFNLFTNYSRTLCNLPFLE